MANPTPAPAAPAPGSATPPAQPDPKATGKVPEVPPQPQPTGDGGTPPAPEAKKPEGLEAELAARLEKDGVKWADLSPAVRNHLMASEMKSREADKRMQLAAKLKKDLDMTTSQANQLIESLKKDPWKVLSNPMLGHDVRKLAEEYVWQMIQEQRMTPEQREAAQAKAELASLKAQQEQAKKEQEQREMDALTAQRRAYWEKAITETMEAEKLPKISYVVRRFTDFIKAASKARVPANLPAIAQHIRQELVSLQQQYLMPPRFNGETDEQYEERILSSAPNDYVKLLRKADLRKLRAKGLAPKPGPKSNSASPAPKGQPKMSMTEWLNGRDQRLGRK